MQIVAKTNIAKQPNARKGPSNTSLGSQTQSHQVVTSKHSGRPQSNVKGTKNYGSDNHPKRVWSIGQVLRVDLGVGKPYCVSMGCIACFCTSIGEWGSYFYHRLIGKLMINHEIWACSDRATSTNLSWTHKMGLFSCSKHLCWWIDYVDPSRKRQNMVAESEIILAKIR